MLAVLGYVIYGELHVCDLRSERQKSKRLYLTGLQILPHPTRKKVLDGQHFFPGDVITA
jgi:hypothetical protein